MSRPAPSMRRRPRALSLALLVAGVWTLALSPILAAQHRATHVHVTCEHGAEIDLGPVAAPMSTPAADHSIDDRGGGTGSEDTHHHCTLGCAATSTVVKQPVAASTFIGLPTLTLAGAPRQIPFAVDVLVDAPKTSPPVAG